MTQHPPIVSAETRATRLRVAWLPDGKRLRLSDGTIDIILQAFGRPGDISRVYDAAIARTRRLLSELDHKLPELGQGRYSGSLLAERVKTAVAVFGAYSAVPAAALAGAIADDVLAVMVETAPLERAFVNNCGRVAFHLEPGQSFLLSMMDRPEGKCLSAKVAIESLAVARGIATSTHKWEPAVGVADSLMVAAVTAAVADVAGGLISRATDIPNRAEAGKLSDAEKKLALGSGMTFAKKLRDEKLIRAAVITVQDEEARLCTDRMRKQLDEA